MEVNDNFRLEDELFGSESRRASAREWSCQMLQETIAKETKKRQREPILKIEEKKKMGPKGKAGEGLAGGLRPLHAHDDNDRLIWCSPSSSAATIGKKGNTLRASFATRNFPSTNLVGRLTGSTCA